MQIQIHTYGYDCLWTKPVSESGCSRLQDTVPSVRWQKLKSVDGWVSVSVANYTFGFVNCARVAMRVNRWRSQPMILEALLTILSSIFFFSVREAIHRNDTIESDQDGLFAILKRL